MTVTIDTGYVVGQLARALASGNEEKARKLEQVFTGMIGGTLTVGSRTPVANVPAWATLEVAPGGFATGELLAGGALQPHELALQTKVDPSGPAPGRTALNLHWLSDAGREELRRMLRTGCFRIDVPEEGALLTVAWLLEHGATDAAQTLLETIAPFFDRLRFYPVPHARPLTAGTAVMRQQLGETKRDLKAGSPKNSVLEMNEALAIWAPLYDRAVALFQETVQDGWPCRVYPPDFALRAKTLLDDYARLRKVHDLCKKPEKKKENFTRLRGYLETAASRPRLLTGRDVGMIRAILAGYTARYGDRLAALRAAQAAIAARPTHEALRAIALERLGNASDHDGLSSLEAFADMPPSILRKLQRSLEAPVQELVALGVLPSAEVLASVLPQMTSRIRAAAIADPDLRRVYAAVYAAFRRRRSLLLLDLQHQVRLEELPWVSALTPFRSSAATANDAERESLREVSALAITAYPETILPNKLVTELRALALGAKLDIPFVEELASDIFMGTFSPKFLHAARIAGRLLAGSLYERYYGVPYEELLGGEEASVSFASICERLAIGKRTDGRAVAVNGTIIEQAQILTTHNLAALFARLDLQRDIASELPVIARACFTWICRSQQQKRNEWRTQMRELKNAAYAWRQMLFLLSVSAEPPAAFLTWAEEHMAKQAPSFRALFAPAMRGLGVVIHGGHFDDAGATPDGGRRFLGWTIERHWLMPPA